MAVCGVGRRKPRAGEYVTSKRAEVRCHRCTASTKVTYKYPGEIEQSLNDRGWTAASGAICCPAHSIRVLPRHRWGRLSGRAVGF